MKVLICIITLLVVKNGIASSDKTVEIKKGGAVIAFSQEDGFKLSPKAIKNLDVSFVSVVGSGPWTLPKSSLVRIKHSTGIYRKWDGWITMVLVKVINETEKTITVKSVDLEAGDLVAVSGVSFLRMTEADLNSDTVDTCSH